MHRAGAHVLAVEAGQTILLDEAEVIALADRYGIAVTSLRDAPLTGNLPGELGSDFQAL